MAIAGTKLRINGGSLDDVITDVGNIFSHTFTGLDPSTEYAIEAAFYDDSDPVLQSDYCTPVTETTDDPPPPPENIALASAGSTVTSSGELDSTGTPDDAVINGDRTGGNSITSGGFTWASLVDPEDTPQWVEVAFNATRSISQVDVIGVQNGTSFALEPVLQEPQSLNTLYDFKVQYWDGAAWVDIVDITGNTDAWRSFFFDAISTTKIRLYITDAAQERAYVAELEAWLEGLNPHKVVIEGDSRAGTGGWDYALSRSLGHNYNFHNVSTGGEALQDIIDDDQFTTQALPAYNPNAVTNTLIQEAGANDFAHSNSLSSIKTNYQNYCEAAQGAGFKVIVCTVFSASSAFIGGGNETNRQDFNTWLRANYTDFADAICDLDADVRLSDPDGPYFSGDHIHLNADGNAVISELMEPTIVSLTT